MPMDMGKRLRLDAAIRLLAILMVIGAGPARIATDMLKDELADRFSLAPDTAPDQQQLVSVRLNGVELGNQLIKVSNGRVTLPAATVQALHLTGTPGQSLDLATETDITVQFDEQASALSLTVPVTRLTAQRFGPDADEVPVRLSPETWGAYVNYDVNLRHEFNLGSSGTATSNGGSAGRNGSGLGSWGGIADLRVLAPDVIGSLGWAYDSTRGGSQALVRLDSTVTWHPSWLNLAASAGDVVSTTNPGTAAARAYRFGGLQVGTDYSATPNWSSSPIPSVTGTAQAQSAIDVYLDGQRTFHTSTAGGPFSLVLPPGASGSGTNVVVTDVTGRSVVIPVEVARVDARLLRQGLFLWSAGLGAPRFAYGSSTTSYDGKLYGYAGARYGLLDALTATLHLEGGPGLAEAETGADFAVTPWLATHTTVAASRSLRGFGGAGRFSAVIAGPWNLGLEAGVARSVGAFNDVVSISGRDFGRRYGISPVLSLPAASELSARLSWQASSRLSLSASYQANSYKGTAPVGFASLNANYLVAGRIPVFANLSHEMGGQRDTTVVMGVTFSFAGVQASVSGGYDVGGSGGLGNQGGYTGGAAASQSLGEQIGDIGWNAYATRAPGSSFANGSAQIRTGYGIPGVAVQSFGNQVTALATLRGSAGVVGLHPFLSDPANGGLIIADAGQSKVPVQLNGYDKGSTSFDGKMAITGAVAGAPQRVAIDTTRLPIDAVPGETDQLVTVRDRGAAMVSFGVRSASSSAIIVVTLDGHPPPVGSTLVSSSSSAPLSKEGRAYLPSLEREEVLTVEMADGTKCEVRSGFDGRGGVGRKLGPLPCSAVHG